MALLDRLIIQGIRSFDPNSNKNGHMEFFSPVTIITGHNGSGKTCLRYACTSDMPPGSQKALFLHDPQLAHQPVVNAQIKLRFIDANKQNVVVTRSMRSTQKAKSLQFQTLESAMERTVPGGGEPVRLSSRCADMDQSRNPPGTMYLTEKEFNEEMIAAFGVTKAVLNNVIFCHQEESSWPLGEARALKMKFDDIFAATKYVQALKKISDLRKAKNNEIVLLDDRKNHLVVNRDLFRKAKKPMRGRSGRLKAQAKKADPSSTANGDGS